MKRITLIFVTAAISGCATITGYDSKLASLKGKSETDLVREWGAPQQVYESGASKFLTYSSSRIISSPGVASGYSARVSGGTMYANPIGGYGALTASRSCTTTFEISGGVVVSSSYKGNDCRGW